ncbi:hypothetical protein [Miniphocaeibacter massiliensis]|uniref:hypothetical protein n=1 Tax=Miniphocaeibacter massiliensis TaxID=2041841 RepID=UPI001A937820|nr:hypothetical protein [Miniphocaeibacter massiliensis]
MLDTLPFIIARNIISIIGVLLLILGLSLKNKIIAFIGLFLIVLYIILTIIYIFQVL